MTDQTLPEESPSELLIELGHLTVRSERAGGVHTVSLAGELDLANADRVDRELADVEASDARSIVVDLTDLSFIDSTGIRLLLAVEARGRTDGARLAMRRPPASVERILRIAGIAESLPFAD